MSRQAAKGSKQPAELLAFHLKSWEPNADPAQLIDRVSSAAGVVRAEFNPQARRLIVLTTLKRDALLESLTALGLELEAEEDDERDLASLPPAGEFRERLSERFAGIRDWLRTAAWVVPASFLLGLVLSVLATASRPVPVLWLVVAGVGLVGVGLLFAGRKLLRRPGVLSEGRLGRPDTALCLLIVLIALLLSGMWLESLLLLVIYGMVQLLPGYVLRRLGRTWAEPLVHLPKQARIVSDPEADGEPSDLPMVDVKTVAPGDFVLVLEGEVVPLDGRVHGDSDAVVSKAAVTGDSIPSIPETGALVPAGAKVEAGSLCLRVERTHAESVLPALRPSTLFQRPLEEGLTGLKAALVGYGPPVVVYVATLVMVVPPLLFGEAVGPWIHRGLAIMLIAPVNSLLFALFGPLLGARTTLAELGGALESDGDLALLGRATRLTLAHSLVIDPHYTLTRIEPLVQMTEDDALRIAASFIADEPHPWGTAFAEAATGQGVDLVPPLQRSEFDGEGLVGKMRTGHEEDEFALGTTAWMQRRGVRLPNDLEERLEEAAREGSFLLWLAYGGRALALFALQGRVKDGTRRLVQRLRKAGVRSVYLLSSHESPLIARFAEQAGLDGGYGQLAAEDMEELIADWQESGEIVASVVSANSGIRLDVPDVTILLDAESPLAARPGQIRMVTEDVSRLHPLLVLARRMRRWHRAALLLVVAGKAGMIALAWQSEPAFLLIGLLEALSTLMVALATFRMCRRA